MNLRDHPMMIRKNGDLIWPPVWTPTQINRDEKPVGEVGILEDVTMSDLNDNKIFMFMQSEGFRYMGFMIFDDVPFCQEIYRLLKSHVGHPINEIGDLDLPHTL
jgi:hypothetical protein